MDLDALPQKRAIPRCLRGHVQAQVRLFEIADREDDLVAHQFPGPGPHHPALRDHRRGKQAASGVEALDVAALQHRIVAVGSTSLRLIESAAAEDGTLAAYCGETALFITPGYRFRAVDAMLTNFHLPRSTLFMLVAAFCGLDVMRRAYAHAIDNGYRFYSYGDACLLFQLH